MMSPKQNERSVAERGPASRGAASRGAQDPARQPEPANPFSTRYVRPGSLEFLFPPGDSLDALCQRLERHGWWGQMVGPHGSGKSTLLESLTPLLESRGRTVVRFTLHAGERRLPAGKDDARTWNAATQVVVDGYEQLGRLSRWWLCRLCRRRGCGLLVTSHRDAGFCMLIRTGVTPATARRVVEVLYPGGCQALLAAGGSSDDGDGGDPLEQLLQRRGGNLREVLFDLYDLYQSRQS